MVSRRGKSSLGCLVTLLVFAAIAYFGVNIGEVYLRFYSFQDSMKQQVRFAHLRSDTDMRRALRAKADSLGLPESAGEIYIRRRPGEILIWSEYAEIVELPLFVREFHFSPQAQRSP